MSAPLAAADLALECLRQPFDGGTRHPAARGAGEPTRRQAAFSSDLSVDEAILVDQAGFDIRGLVVGGSVFQVGMPGLETRWGQSAEVTSLSSVMYQARERAVEKMVSSTNEVAGSGVVGVHLRIEMLQGGRSRTGQFLAIGTAVADKDESRRPLGTPFTSDLSGKDLYLLVSAGYRPLGMVMGSCVYHVAHRRFGQWATSVTKNQEMTGFTEALYEARELAMSRLQDEALHHGADGVVGVTTTERSHVWGSHVIEFFAVGTAVKLVEAGHRNLDPRIVMGLDDPKPAVNPAGIVRSSE